MHRRGEDCGAMVGRQSQEVVMADVEFLSTGAGFVLLDDGTQLPITDYFDADGDDCEPARATVCVAGTDDFGWLTIDLEGHVEMRLT